MNKFARLTTQNEGVVIVNFDNITEIYEHPTNGGCTLYFSGGDGSTFIREPIQDVIKIIGPLRVPLG